MLRPLSWIAVQDEAGQRLDLLLTEKLGGVSRAAVRRLCDAGAVLVDRRQARAGHTIRAGEHIELRQAPEPTEFDPAPNPEVPVGWVYVDGDLVVIDKPAGVPSHPLRVAETGTAANALIARCPEIAGIGYRRREAGLVHRLDTETSGLLLCARTVASFAALAAALRAGKIEKGYTAVCNGRVAAPQVIAVALETDPADPRRVRVAHQAVDRGGAARLTRVVSVEAHGDRSWVQLVVHRAGRHQVRAHLASMGHPLVGDVLYGGPRVASAEGRHLLHACGMVFDHPRTGRRLVFRSPQPADMARPLDRSPGDA